MDDLTQIKGIGKATADKLAAAGVASFAHLADLAPDHSAREEVDIKGEWIEQAKTLVETAPPPPAETVAPPPAGTAPPPPPAGTVAPDATPATGSDDEAANVPVAAATNDTPKPDEAEGGIRIAAKRHGFRRCGIAHPSAPVDHPEGRFTDEQIEILKGEPMLVVQDL